MMCAQPARAYRPFDGTDAAVADPGEFEIELGPTQYQRDGAEHSLIAPALTINYGIAHRCETVIEGEAVHSLGGETHRNAVIGNAASLKTVLREGSLQDRLGPSVATEFGILLPGINSEPGTGGSLAGIVSQRWSWITIHLNASAVVTRQQHGDLFLSTILEGPHDWAIRPVAELSYEKDFGSQRALSGLFGAIWQVRDNLSFDLAVRRARLDTHTLDEVRAGLTFGFGVPSLRAANAMYERRR
jgi:hypothetical protein